LREEVDVLKHLSRAAQAASLPGGVHPNVLGYVDNWEQDERLFLRTELCELGSLARFLWEFGRVCPRLDEARVWKIFAELSAGLAFVHGAGVIHLDLKPANVFVTAEGRFKVGDFGMATLWPRPRAVEPLADMEGRGFEREGDKVYMAAEVLQGCYGPAADVFRYEDDLMRLCSHRLTLSYSLGMIMLEAASNIVVPDQGEPWHRLRREDLSQVELDGFSPELVQLLLACMRSDPEQRATALEVANHPVVSRARKAMESHALELRMGGRPVFGASALASVPDGWLDAVLGYQRRDDDEMDLSM
jgi:mitosis inhibitor protein kinase SWE1